MDPRRVRRRALQGTAPAQQPRRDELAPDLITARFARGAPAATTSRRYSTASTRRSCTTIPELDIRSLHVEPEQLQNALLELRRSDLVVRAEQERLVPLIDLTASDVVDGDWGPRLIRAPGAWDVTRGSSKVVVAVLDTGVDSSHPDLRGSLVAGYDVVDGDAVPDDMHGHGTAVAGIVGAQAGLCPACSLMAIRILDAKGYGTTSTIAAGIVRAVNSGARVLNLSVGSTGTTETMADGVRYALDRGAVLVAAAGNDGLDDAMYPAAYPGVISVAATDEGDRLYSWSNHGAKVLLAAPGCNTAPLSARQARLLLRHLLRDAHGVRDRRTRSVRESGQHARGDRTGTRSLRSEGPGSAFRPRGRRPHARCVRAGVGSDDHVEPPQRREAALGRPSSRAPGRREPC